MRSYAILCCIKHELFLVCLAEGFVVKSVVESPAACQTIEANLLPCTTTAIKGSSVSLRWNYTYIGDGRHNREVLFHSLYKEQVIGISSSLLPRPQVLAKRIGQNGVLIMESPVPAQFQGRVEVISSNNTVVIHNLQYNDSAFQFSSKVTISLNFHAGPELHHYPFRSIRIMVTGMY